MDSILWVHACERMQAEYLQVQDGCRCRVGAGAGWTWGCCRLNVPNSCRCRVEVGLKVVGVGWVWTDILVCTDL